MRSHKKIPTPARKQPTTLRSKPRLAPYAPFSLELASTVRKQRKSLGITQQQLGQFAGCGALFIHELEAGKSTLRLSKLIDVLKVLGLELNLEFGKSGFRVSSKIADLLK